MTNRIPRQARSVDGDFGRSFNKNTSYNEGSVETLYGVRILMEHPSSKIDDNFFLMTRLV